MSEGKREAETRPRMTSINHGERSHPVSRRDDIPPSDNGRGGGVIDDSVDRWGGDGALDGLIDLFLWDCNEDGDLYCSDDGSSISSESSIYSESSFSLEEEEMYCSRRNSLEASDSESRSLGAEARKLPSFRESTEETPQRRTVRKMTTDSWAAKGRGGGDDSDSSTPTEWGASEGYRTNEVGFAAPADRVDDASEFALSPSSSLLETSRGRKSDDGTDHSGDWDAEETSGTVVIQASSPLRDDATVGADAQTTVVAANRAITAAMNKATPTGGESKIVPDSSKDASPRQPKRGKRRKFSFGFFGAKRKKGRAIDSGRPAKKRASEKEEASDATRICRVTFPVESASSETDITAPAYAMSEAGTDDTIPIDFPWRYPIVSFLSSASECDGRAERISVLTCPSTMTDVNAGRSEEDLSIVPHRPGVKEKKKGAGKGMSRWNPFSCSSGGLKDEKKQGATKKFSFLRQRRRTKKKKTNFASLVMRNGNHKKLVERKPAEKSRRRHTQENRSSKTNEVKQPHRERIRRISRSKTLEKTRRKESEKGVNTNKALNDFAAGTRSGSTTPRKATDKNSAESKRTTNELRRKSARTERYRSPSEFRARTPAGGTGNAAETAVATERRGRIPKDDGGRGCRRSSTAGGRGGAPHARRGVSPTDAERGGEGPGGGRRRRKDKHVRVPELSLYWKQVGRSPTMHGTYLRTDCRGTGEYLHSQRNQHGVDPLGFRPSVAKPGRVYRLR